MSLADTRKDLMDLRMRLKEISDALHKNFEDSLDNLASDDGYPIKMFRFVNEAKAQLESLTDKVTLAETAFSNLLRFYGENDQANAMTTTEFYGNLKEFLSSYKVRFVSNLQTVIKIISMSLTLCNSYI